MNDLLGTIRSELGNNDIGEAEASEQLRAGLAAASPVFLIHLAALMQNMGLLILRAWECRDTDPERAHAVTEALLATLDELHGEIADACVSWLSVKWAALQAAPPESGDVAD